MQMKKKMLKKHQVSIRNVPGNGYGLLADQSEEKVDHRLDLIGKVFPYSTVKTGVTLKKTAAGEGLGVTTMGIEKHKINETKVAKQLKKLIEANQYLADIESLDALFPRLLDLAKNVTAAEASSLMLYNP